LSSLNKIKIQSHPYRIFLYGWLFFLFNIRNASAQTNLVPNSSFEEYSTCPNYINQLYYCDYWFSPTRNTPDYFNSCFTGLAIQSPDIPLNHFGFQNARTGNAYAGIHLRYSSPLGKEYISIRLLDSLSSGKKYCFEFHVSLADSSRNGINLIGLYLSNTNDTIYTDTVTSGLYNGVLNYQTVYQSQLVITDTISWVKINGEFYANGGEQYLIIGSFVNNSMLTIDSIQSAGYFMTSYYYIDDVSLYECPDIPPDSTSTITIPNAFSPNGDGINDLFSPETENLKSYSCTIFNRWGNQVFNSDEVSRSWDGKYNGCECPEGVYYYIIEANGLDGKQYRQSGFVMLMR
jgi:gliding motility-associated-like protein